MNDIYNHKAIDDLPPLRDLVESENLKAKKSMGQNFLFDLNITRKIARHAHIDRNTTVIEIGPGPGGLTRALLTETLAKKIIAIEKDTRFIQALQPLIARSHKRLDIINIDALKADLLALSDAPRSIVANLPYNVATPLLMRWLKNITEYQSLTLMFQKEVANRIVALPQTKAYGRLSVMTQWVCDAHIVFDLPPDAFTPPPKVNSSVVYFTPKERQDSISWQSMEKLVATAFNKRRKMLRQSLKSYAIDWDKIKIDPTKRAEELTVKDYCHIAQSLND